MVQEALNEIKGNEVETEIISLVDYNIKGCIACEKCKDTYKCVIMDDMQKLYPKLLEADAIILGSPTYFYNITSLMKAFIERLYCFQLFSKEDRFVWSSINEVLGIKYAVIISICEQNSEEDMGFTAQAMAKPLEGLGYRIVETVKVLKLFERGEAKLDKKALEQVKTAGKKIEKTVRLKEETNKKLESYFD